MELRLRLLQALFACGDLGIVILLGRGKGFRSGVQLPAAFLNGDLSRSQLGGSLGDLPLSVAAGLLQLGPAVIQLLLGRFQTVLGGLHQSVLQRGVGQSSRQRLSGIGRILLSSAQGGDQILPQPLPDLVQLPVRLLCLGLSPGKGRLLPCHLGLRLGNRVPGG